MPKRHRLPHWLITVSLCYDFYYRFTKPKPKPRRIFSLPSKLMNKEVRLTVLLISVVFSHVLLTLPGTIANFMFTVFPDTWNEYDGQLDFEAIADLLMCVNYSMSFFLYCAAHREIRIGVTSAVREAWNEIVDKFGCSREIEWEVSEQTRTS